MSERVPVLSELARALSRQDPSQSLALRLDHAATAIAAIAGADGAAITLAYTRLDRVTLCVTGDLSARMEDLQDVLGQGPGAAAYDGERQVHVQIGAGHDHGWPQFERQALLMFGPLTVHAIPIHPHRNLIGVLTLHQGAERELATNHETIQFLADAVGVALLQEPVESTDSEGPWASRAQIHQATGMVIAQLKISVGDAVALLRAHAFAHDWTLSQAAAAVVVDGFDFSGPDPPPRHGPDLDADSLEDSDGSTSS